MRVVLSLLFAALLLANPATAQGPVANKVVKPSSPEMWYYQQILERRDSPKEAVRRKSEARAQQRQARIASMKWYGVSASRPTVSATPMTSNYGHSWYGSQLRPHAWNYQSARTWRVAPAYYSHRR